MYHGWNHHLGVPSLLQAGSHQRVYPTSKTDLDGDDEDDDDDDDGGDGDVWNRFQRTKSQMTIWYFFCLISHHPHHHHR